MHSIRLAPALLLLVTACVPNDVPAREFQAEIGEVLRTTVGNAQAAYLDAHDRYASNLSELVLEDGDLGEVDVRIVGANEWGWSATAEHRSLPGRPCTIFIGSPPTYAALPTSKVGRSASWVGAPGVVHCQPPR